MKGQTMSEVKLMSVEPMSEEEIVKLSENDSRAVERLQMLVDYQKVVKSQQADIDRAFKVLENVMLDKGIQNIKGEFGNIYITERTSWSYDQDKLAKKFFIDNTPDEFKGFDFMKDEFNEEQRQYLKDTLATRTVDPKRLTDTYKLEGKAPRGSAPNTSKSITKRLK